MLEAIKALLRSNLFVTIVGCIVTYILTICHERKKSEATANKALQEENEKLRSQLEIYEATSSSRAGDFLVRKVNGEAICPVCWRADRNAIPIYEKDDTGHYICGKCGTKGIYSYSKAQHIKEENEAAQKRLLDAIGTVNSNRNSLFR